jgi:hypothetical protein
MRYFGLILLSFLVLTGCSKKSAPVVSVEKPAVSQESGRSTNNGEFSPSTLIIFYDSVIGKTPLMKAVSDYHATLIYDYRMMSGIAIKIPAGKDINDAIKYFEKVKGVLQVNRDRICHLDDGSIN